MTPTSWPQDDGKGGSLSPLGGRQWCASVVGDAAYAMSVENPMTRSIVLYPAPTRTMDVRRLGAFSKCRRVRGVCALRLSFKGPFPAMGAQSATLVGSEGDLVERGDGLQAGRACLDLQACAPPQGREVAV